MFPEDCDLQARTLHVVGMIQELGFNCSIDNGEELIATKRDITDFLSVPENTLNNFLRKYREEISPIRLDALRKSVTQFAGRLASLAK